MRKHHLVSTPISLSIHSFLFLIQFNPLNSKFATHRPCPCLFMMGPSAACFMTSFQLYLFLALLVLFSILFVLACKSIQY